MAEQNSFFGIKSGEKKKKFTVPYKKTMNLVVIEQAINWTKIIIIALILVVAVAAAAKFGILDPLEKKNAAVNLRGEKEVQYATLNTKMVEYNKVEEKYGRYSYGWMNESEQSMLQKEKVLAIVEEKIASACTINSLAISNNTMSLSVSGVTLEEAREIVKQLKEDENVTSAMVYSAVSTEENHKANISMTVIFNKEAIQ